MLMFYIIYFWIEYIYKNFFQILNIGGCIRELLELEWALEMI